MSVDFDAILKLCCKDAFLNVDVWKDLEANCL